MITPVFIAVLKNLVLIPVRISPYDTENELNELYEVFLFVKDKWKTEVSPNTPSQQGFSSSPSGL